MHLIIDEAIMKNLSSIKQENNLTTKELNKALHSFNYKPINNQVTNKQASSIHYWSIGYKQALKN